MSLPESRRIQLPPALNICRILNGMGQVSKVHGAIDPKKAIPSMFNYLNAAKLLGIVAMNTEGEQQGRRIKNKR